MLSGLWALLLVVAGYQGTVPLEEPDFSTSLADAAETYSYKSIQYDGSYHTIPYPGGDVPETIGVCADLIIRSYREMDIDLQKLVHEDMRNNFDQYPSFKRCFF